MFGQLGTGNDWVSLQAGTEHSCGLKTEGSLWCWARNDTGALGNGTKDVWTNTTGVPSHVLGDEP